MKPLTSRTTRCLVGVVSVFLAFPIFAQNGGQLRFCIHSEPKIFNPIMVEDDASETIRYLTGGVLVRLSRKTQQLEPELATSWKLSKDGRTISFKLRKDVFFSDGTPFTADDVAFTMKRLMDPALHSPTGDSFRSGNGDVLTGITDPHSIVITFPAPVASLDKLFDQVAIMSSRSPLREKAVLGPFVVADYKPGAYVLLKRNNNYWKTDATGRKLPYLDSVRLDIQQNRDLEILRFQRGEIQLINSLDSEYFDRLASQSREAVYDAGASLDSEEMWFNQAPTSPIPDYKKQWFQSTNFRRAISTAINRDDIVRLVFNGHATPALGPVSPANHFWVDKKLAPHPFSPSEATRLLSQDGFHRDGDVLRDRAGHPVEFSIVTNAGNRQRERMAALIQQDLANIGIKLTIVTLDFPSLIDRITRSFNYDACLLGLTNTDIDPNGQMNIWLSSAENHQWNPNQKQPATAWEAEIDRLMKVQATSMDMRKRKESFDRVQEIVRDQEPFIYLVNKNSLAAVSNVVYGADPVALRPQTYWEPDRISLAVGRAAK